jgi:hypothetical protein
VSRGYVYRLTYQGVLPIRKPHAAAAWTSTRSRALPSNAGVPDTRTGWAEPKQPSCSGCPAAASGSSSRLTCCRRCVTTGTGCSVDLRSRSLRTLAALAGIAGEPDRARFVLTSGSRGSFVEADLVVAAVGGGSTAGPRTAPGTGSCWNFRVGPMRSLRPLPARAAPRRHWAETAWENPAAVEIQRIRGDRTFASRTLAVSRERGTLVADPEP